MPTLPNEVTASMAKTPSIMVEVNRLAGPDAKVVQGWVGEDVLFIVAHSKNGGALYFLNLTLMAHDTYKGYIDNTMAL
jgi:hypothetical protein